MSDVDTPQAPAAPVLGPSRAAWLATALGIPVYGALALLFSYTAAPLVAVLAPDRTTAAERGIYLGVAVVNVLIALFGILVVSHTVGRAVFAATRRWTDPMAAVAFAAMGSILAAAPVMFIAYGTSEQQAGGVFAILAIGVPCGVTAGLTRWLLPGVAASPSASRLAGWVAALSVLVILVWTAVVLFGAGR